VAVMIVAAAAVEAVSAEVAEAIVNCLKDLRIPGLSLYRGSPFFFQKTMQPFFHPLTLPIQTLDLLRWKRLPGIIIPLP
jgi:hypothetical protein